VAVTVERDGDGYIVVLDRPQVRNAVDREHAERSPTPFALSRNRTPRSPYSSAPAAPSAPERT
jgi:hypothetical protein